MRNLRILLTRPKPDAARTAARLLALGHRVLIDPLLAIEPVAEAEPPAGPFAAVTATSANALRVAAGMDKLEFLRSLPLYAVGGHTGEAARAAGFRTVVVAEGDATALAELVANNIESGARVLHLAGADLAQDLAALLAPIRIIVDTLVVYRARPARALAKVTVAALASASLDAVMHYSPRSAMVFMALAEQANLTAAIRGLRHLCLSEAVAAPLRSVGIGAEIAIRPEEAALIELLGS